MGTEGGSKCNGSGFIGNGKSSYFPKFRKYYFNACRAVGVVVQEVSQKHAHMKTKVQ